MTCFYYKKYKKGMSLVEVLVAISIVALMAAISFSFLGGTSKDRVFLENACNEFVGVVNKERAEALASSGSKAGGVIFNINSSDYSSLNVVGPPAAYESHTLPKGVIFNSTGNVKFEGVDATCTGCSDITLKRSAASSSTKTVVFKGSVASCQ